MCRNTYMDVYIEIHIEIICENLGPIYIYVCRYVYVDFYIETHIEDLVPKLRADIYVCIDIRPRMD